MLRKYRRGGTRRRRTTRGHIKEELSASNSSALRNDLPIEVEDAIRDVIEDPIYGIFSDGPDNPPVSGLSPTQCDTLCRILEDTCRDVLEDYKTSNVTGR